MLRLDWLLLFVAAAPGHAVDPIRLQKGLFLLAMRDVLPPEQRYEFEPYAYGPMSRALYRDVRVLEERRLVEEQAAVAGDWRSLVATQLGLARAASARARASAAHPEALHEVEAIRHEVGQLTFSELLAHVYDLHPEFAVRSVFRRP